MSVATPRPDMAKSSRVFGLVTAVIVLGSFVLLFGVADHMRLDLIGAGSAVMVLGILGLAGSVGSLSEPEGHDGDSGH